MAPVEVLDRLLAMRGATPSSVRPSTELRVLRVLRDAPQGLPSARAVAVRAGVSPTTAATVLARLVEEGLVTDRQYVVGRYRRSERRIEAPLGPHWPDSLDLAVATTRLPQIVLEDGPLPRDLYRYLRNARDRDPHLDGPYMARRLLLAPDVRAWRWALSNLARSDLQRALRLENVSEDARSLAHAWWGREEAASKP